MRLSHPINTDSAQKRENRRWELGAVDEYTVVNDRLQLLRVPGVDDLDHSYRHLDWQCLHVLT